MSREKLQQEADRWYRQSIDDLDAAQALIAAHKFAQACFYAQQATEKGLKAVWISLDSDPWGHFYTRLIRDLPQPAQSHFQSLINLALALDKLYIPTRYPNALVELTPAEAFTQGEAQTALAAAQRLLHQVEQWLRA
ncbi:HEPN domain-containing protein [Leptolyngbya sp. PCC 6406]|uniref:HEPN domain-containing protein n=1 Tax=Leptolyngbya sp. PCC 6406 TaxID=1173264 RepID=UPI0002AC456F|nr:HEPN domain-containing protein [Leptolyngbya sp. PCC 6406]